MIDPAPRSTSPTGPGCVMVAAIIGGTFFGLRSHQATIGLLGGIGVALAIIVLMWVWDRVR